MSTIYNSSLSSSESNSSNRTESTRPKDRREPAREPPAEGSVDRFRNLMQQRDGKTPLAPGQERLAGEDKAAAQLEKKMPTGGAQAGADARRAEHASDARHSANEQMRRVTERNQGDHGWDLGRQDSGNNAPPAEASAMWQAQLAMRDAATQTQLAAPTSNAAAFADLIERHVRQMAVSSGVAGDGDGQVLLRLADDTLPGTDLLLSKTADGWQLRADVRSRSSFDAIREAGPELARRFAERGLGQLSVDPRFHD